MTLRKHSNASGFTLIELMVVIVIVGIASAALSLSMRSDPAQLLREDAARLQLVLAAAQSEAQIMGRPILWQADEQGYRFVHWQSGKVIKDDLLKPREWRAAPVTVHLSPMDRLIFNAEWIEDPMRIQLSDGTHHLLVERNAAGRIFLP